MKATARLYNCARCHKQVVLCSHCDNGNIYCLDGCAARARRESIRKANKRYRRGRKGRTNAAHRQANHRRRKRSHIVDEAESENKVTHQGSPGDCSSDSMPNDSEANRLEQKSPVTATSSASTTAPADEIHCRCCGRPVRLQLRRGYLRQRRRKISDPSVNLS